VGLGVALGISALEWCLIVVVIGLVWAAEAFNTALEALADAVTLDQHPRVGVAKDAAAGAVLACAVAAAIVGAIVFVPRLLALVAA
jgi:diacylglycerol kinase (ATP)